MKYTFDNIIEQVNGEYRWNIPEYFNIAEACVEQHLSTDCASRIAMIIEDDEKGQSELTYQQLSNKSSQFANLLKDLKLNKNERVLIRLPNQLEYPIAFFGALKYGAIAVPTSTLLAGAEVAYLAEDSGAKVLVTDHAIWSEIANEIKDSKIETVILTGILTKELASNIKDDTDFQILYFNDLIESFSTTFSYYKSKSNDPAYLVYTSGTTGYPKGVLHAHRALLGRLPASKCWFDLDSNNVERIMHSGKFNWTYVLGSALMDPLLHGHTVIAYEGKNDAKTWPQLIQKHQCSIFIGVPTIYRQIIQKTNFTKKDLPSLKHCMSAGEHLSDEMQLAWKQRFDNSIYEAIGMSEVSYYISQHKNATVKPGAAGFVQPGHYVDLLSEELNPASAMEEGMISIREDDPGLFLEYWRKPEETAKSKHDGWFFTGDFAKKDDQGYVWFLGRKDDIINSFGYRISPHEIERVIKSHEAVSDCVALGEEIDNDKTLVVICVILKKEASVSQEELLQFGKTKLAKYKAPKKVYLMENFPKTKNGKILRKQLLKLLAQQKESL